jgi:putative nucleotidyltransferase with HDIG domain
MDDRLINLAQLALNYAVQNGGNQICLASDIQTPMTLAELNLSSSLQNSIQQINAENIYRVAISIDKKNGSNHSEEVAGIAVAIAKMLNLTQYNIEKIRKAALLHDVGKIAIPDALMNGAPYSDLERSDAFLKHPELGAAIVRQIPELALCAPAIKHHHERHDGSGFPDNLKGEQIPMDARIISVAEVYAYLTRSPNLEKNLTPEQAVKELQSRPGKFDPVVLIALEKAVFTRWRHRNPEKYFFYYKEL